jgi:hypothetical protein
MGNAASGEDEGDYYQEEEDDYAKQFDGIDTLGYRVLGVQPDSPGKLISSLRYVTLRYVTLHYVSSLSSVLLLCFRFR